jgi:Protein of unknown function (DUF1115)
MMAVSLEQLWKTAERAIQEVDALAAIYGEISAENDDGSSPTASFATSSFSVISSQEELEEARSIVEDDSDASKRQVSPPEVRIEIQTTINVEIFDQEAHNDGGSPLILLACLQVRLSPGYPEYEHAFISSLMVQDFKKTAFFRRSIMDAIVADLNDKAQSLLGSEAIMDIMETAKELIEMHAKQQQQLTSNETATAASPPNSYGRRWIWVHHITNMERRKSILREAKSLHLGGYLKYGYPGVMVVEGTTANCDEFVSWVKGNKSRPGGFGRNWGHHVRGEINFEDESGERLPTHFDEIEDLSLLSAACKDCGLEDEFLEFVMQHKGYC